MSTLDRGNQTDETQLGASYKLWSLMEEPMEIFVSAHDACVDSIMELQAGRGGEGAVKRALAAAQRAAKNPAVRRAAS